MTAHRPAKAGPRRAQCRRYVQIRREGRRWLWLGNPGVGITPDTGAVLRDRQVEAGVGEGRQRPGQIRVAARRKLGVPGPVAGLGPYYPAASRSARSPQAAAGAARPSARGPFLAYSGHPRRTTGSAAVHLAGVSATLPVAARRSNRSATSADGSTARSPIVFLAGLRPALPWRPDGRRAHSPRPT